MKRWRAAQRRDNLGAWFVLLLLVVLGVFGVLAVTAPARADVVDRYVDAFSAAVCRTLDDYPTADGILGIVTAIERDGLTYEQAAAVVVQSVLGVCPEYVPLVKRAAGVEARTKIA